MQQQAGQSPGALAVASPSRPEGLPEQFWDAETGSVKFEDLGKSYNELSAFKAQADSLRAAAPETPDGYAFRVPDSVKLPDGYTFVANPDDPLVSLGRQVAHRAGLDQSGFDDLVKMYAEHQTGQAQQLETWKGEQVKALGPQGPQRVAAVKQYLTAVAGAAVLPVFDFVLDTKSGVEAIERLMRHANSGGVPSYGQSGRESGAAPELDRSKMTPAERFHFADRGAKRT